MFPGMVEAAIMRLADKRFTTLTGEFEQGLSGYALTELGRVAAGIKKSGLREFATAELPQEVNGENSSEHEHPNPI